MLSDKIYCPRYKVLNNINILIDNIILYKIDCSYLTESPIKIPMNGIKYWKYIRMNFGSNLYIIRIIDDGKKEIANNVTNVKLFLNILCIIKQSIIKRIKYEKGSGVT